MGTGRGKGGSLAAKVADAIVDDVMTRGWPEGEVIGSEQELLDRYEVSRAVFREAVRLVEHKGVARMRRGPGGGLVVTGPSFESALVAVAVYLYYVGASVDEVFDARLALEEVVAELTPSRLTEADVLALRELIDRERRREVHDLRELHALLAAFTKNPALEFFVDLLNQVSSLFLDGTGSLRRGTLAAASHAHAAIAESVLAGDGAHARNRMRKHLRAEADFLRKGARNRIVIPGPDDDAKTGLKVAFAIFAEITEGGWEVGRLVGSERDLLDRYEVSRAVIREAVRMLEHHKIARMRRGPGGGLFVSEPGVTATTEAVALYLQRGGITPAQLFEVRSAVELAALDRAVERLGPEDETALRSALDAERGATLDELRDMAHGVHAVLADASGNRVLELLALVLLRLTRIQQGPTPRRQVDRATAEELTNVHEHIVAAVVDGDAELARVRMRLHLRKLSEFIG